MHRRLGNIDWQCVGRVGRHVWGTVRGWVPRVCADPHTPHTDTVADSADTISNTVTDQAVAVVGRYHLRCYSGNHRRFDRCVPCGGILGGPAPSVTPAAVGVRETAGRCTVARRNSTGRRPTVAAATDQRVDPRTSPARGCLCIQEWIQYIHLPADVSRP